MGYAYTYPAEHGRILDNLPESLRPHAQAVLADRSGADLKDVINALRVPTWERQLLHDAFRDAR